MPPHRAPDRIAWPPVRPRSASGAVITVLVVLASCLAALAAGAVIGGGLSPRVVLTHGEDPERAALAAAIRERFGIEAEMPGKGAVLEV